MAEPIVELKGVCRSYGDVQALAPLDLLVRRGSVLGLLGPNGAGKTTLLSILGLVLRPSEGSVRVAGRTINNTHDVQIARRHISLMPQHPSAPPAFTAREVVEYAGWLKGVERTRRSRALEVLEGVGLGEVANLPLKKLSGGMVQRVHLACALISEPDLLLLDEPTVGLDPAQRIAFRDLLLAMDQTAVVLSTHLVEDVRAVSTDILVLANGHQRFRGDIVELEMRATPDAPGDSDAERGYMALLNVEAGA